MSTHQIGRVPFDTLFLPEVLKPIDKGNIYFNTEGRERITDKPELEGQIQRRITLQQQKAEEFNKSLRERLVSEGLPEEEIQPRLRKFFDGKLARLHPEDVSLSSDSLSLRLGNTTYFTYAGSRSREDLEKYGYERLGLALAVCSIITVPSKDGTDKLLYTVRGTANETYPGWFHAVGGTIQSIENGIPNPTRALIREITQESGLKSEEFNVAGVIGAVMNNFDIHPELIYNTTADLPIEDWLGKRKTDKEVDIAYFTDTPANLEAFILGQKTDELSDARPIVPSGLSSYLFYGRLKYGLDWYNRVYSKIPQY